MAADYIQKKADKEAKQGTKRKDADAADAKLDKRRASEGQQEKRPPKQDAKVTKPTLSIDTAGDVEWAVSLLAPLGFKADSVDPIVRSPAAVVLPILEALSSLEQTESFRQLLKDTNIGKVINNFRHHPNAEVGKKAKALIASWRVAAAKPIPKEGSGKKVKSRRSSGGAPTPDSAAKKRERSGDGVDDAGTPRSETPGSATKKLRQNGSDPAVDTPAQEPVAKPEAAGDADGGLEHATPSVEDVLSLAAAGDVVSATPGNGEAAAPAEEPEVPAPRKEELEAGPERNEAEHTRSEVVVETPADVETPAAVELREPEEKISEAAAPLEEKISEAPALQEKLAESPAPAPVVQRWRV